MSEIVTVALRVPIAIGVKVTLIVQLAPTATELPHVFVCAKSPALAPVMAMLLMLNVVLPVLLNVATFAGLLWRTRYEPQVRLVADSVTDDWTPVPVKPTICGLPIALSLIVRLAARLPAACGVKVIMIVQLAPEATELPQLFV